jgi:hypothetical protein
MYYTLQSPGVVIVHGIRPEPNMRVHKFSIHAFEITTRVRAPRLVGRTKNVINETELRELSPAERRQLARTLATIDYPHPMLGLYLSRGRRVGALVSIISCTVLVGWIIILALTLHRSFHAEHWRGAWVGFDIILLLAFAATGWAFWRGRQIVIASLLVTGTLLLCDAWFDVFLDAGTSDIWGSVASAVIVELPLAFLMFNAARRLIRLSALMAMGESGDGNTIPPVWKIPLLGMSISVDGSARKPSAVASGEAEGP